MRVAQIQDEYKKLGTAGPKAWQNTGSMVSGAFLVLFSTQHHAAKEWHRKQIQLELHGHLEVPQFKRMHTKSSEGSRDGRV